MVIKYPQDRITIDGGILRIRAISADSEIKSFSINIPNNVRINNTSYGLDISGQDNELVYKFCDHVKNHLARMNG